MFFFDWIKRRRKKRLSYQSTEFNPRPDCLEAIENKPCVPDIYACRHKCKDAYLCFRKHGQKAKVVRGRVVGLEDDHIWMELIDEKDPEEPYWYDPTWYRHNPAKYGCHKASLWTDRRVLRDKINGVIKPTGDTSPPNRD